MEQEFTQATKSLQALQTAITAAQGQNSGTSIRNVNAALENLTAIYVCARAGREGLHGQHGAEDYYVGVVCGDGSCQYEIDAGVSGDHGKKIAREILRHARGMEVLANQDQQPFIAVNPARVARVEDCGGRLIIGVQNSAHSFTVQHTDAHRAYIDSYLLDNKLVQMRGVLMAAQEKTVQVKTGPIKTGQSLQPPRPEITL